MKSERLFPSAEYRKVFPYFLRILLPLVFSSLLAFLLYFAVGTWYEKQLIRSEQAQQVQLSVRSLQRDISGVIRELRYLAASDSLRRFTASGEEGARRTAEREMAEFARYMERYDQVRWLDLKGRERLRVDHRNDITRIVPQQELQDKSSRYYFTEAIVLPPGAIYVSPLDLNIEHGELELPYRPMLRFAMPTADEQGMRNGLLILNYQASRMLDNFARSKHKEPSRLYLLNAEGYWLYASDGQPEWAFMFGRDERFQHQYPQAWAAIRGQSEGTLLNESGLFTYSTITTPMLLGAAPPAMHGKSRSFALAQQKWYVVSLYPRPALHNVYLEHAGFYSVLFTLIILLLTAISWKLARTMGERNRLMDRLALHAKLMETATNGVLITDRDTKIVAVNQGFTDLTGYSREEVIGQSPSVIASGRHDVDFYAGMWRALKKDGHWEGEIWNRHKNGEVFPEWLSISAIRNSDGELTNYIGIFSLLSEHKSTAARLRELASSDPLTGLTNRNLLYDRAGQALAHAHRTGGKTAFLFLDLDGFKPINDAFGHAAGDRVLKEVAKRLKACVRESDTVARFGGDEFMLLLPELKTDAEVAAIAEKITCSISQPIAIGEQECHVGVSIGISIYPEDGDSVEELVKHADEAMYHAKATGKGHSEFFHCQ